MSAIPKSYRSKLVICASMAMVIGVFAALLSEPEKRETFWLPVAQARALCQEHGAPSRLSRLKYQVINAVPPLRRWYYRRPTNVLLEMMVLKAPATLPQDTDLGQSVATNSSGERIWIVAPAAVPAFRAKYLEQVNTNDNYDITLRPRFQTADGLAVFLTSHETAITSYNMGSSSWPPLPPQWDDFEMNLVATKVSNSFELQAAMTPIASTGNTNAPFGFRLGAPAAGIVVMDCGDFTNRSGIPYWIFLAATDVRANTRVLR